MFKNVNKIRDRKYFHGTHLYILLLQDHSISYIFYKLGVIDFIESYEI